MKGRITKPTMPIWYSVVILLVMCAGLAVTGWFYTKSVAEDLKSEIIRSEAERDRNLCGVIDASLGIEPGQVPPPTPPPSTTPRGQRVVKEMIALRSKLECP